MSTTPTTRFAAKFWGRAIAVVAVIVAAAWVVWGFRWPPTAGVVDDDAQVEQMPPPVGAEGPSRDRGHPRRSEGGVSFG